MRVLLFGYGNIDRQDDGVAWHLLRGVADRYHYELPEFPEEPTAKISPDITCTFALQLSPESAEAVSQFDLVIFIDAHTGSVDEELHFELIHPYFQSSPFTHHLTPQTCLALAESLYGKAPQAYLVSVRGYEFGFSRKLSPQTGQYLAQAVKIILETIGHTGDAIRQF